MKFSDLVKLIHGLSKKQKSNFSRYTASQKETLPYKLYKRIISAQRSVYIDDKIKGKEFMNDSSFQTHKSILISRIRESIAQYEYNELSFENQILAAIQMGDHEWASKAVLKEICRLYNEGRFENATYLWGFINELSVFHRFVLDDETVKAVFFPEIKNQLNCKAIVGHSLNKGANDYRRLIRALNEIRDVTKQPKKEQNRVANKWRAQASIEYSSEVNNTLAKMLAVRIDYLDEEIESAVSKGKGVLQILISNQNRYPVLMLDAEIRFNVLLAMKLFDQSQATSTYWKFREIRIDNPQHNKIIEASQIFLGATLSATYADLNMAEKISSMINENTTFASKAVEIVTHYNLGRAFFHNESYTNAIECMNLVRNLMISNYHALKWEPQAILAICHFSIGNITAAESEIRSAKRVARNFPEKYPSLTMRIIEKHFKAPINKGVSIEDYNKVQEIMNSQDEDRLSKNFPIHVWILSLLQKKSQHEIIEQFRAAKQDSLDNTKGFDLMAI